MFSKFCECYYKSVIPAMEEHEMVPDYSFFQAVASCLITILPKNFYNKVNEGSIILKKGAFSFCQDGVILEGENLPVRSDIVIFATGYRGDLKLRDIFTSPFFQDAMAGPESSIVPLYRLVKEALFIFIFLIFGTMNWSMQVRSVIIVIFKLQLELHKFISFFLKIKEKNLYPPAQFGDLFWYRKKKLTVQTNFC